MDFSKYLGEMGLLELWNLMIQQLDKRVFIGTKEEYELNAENIPNGALVIITDESDVIIPFPEEENNKSHSLLGTAILGQMKLGKE